MRATLAPALSVAVAPILQAFVPKPVVLAHFFGALAPGSRLLDHPAHHFDRPPCFLERAPDFPQLDGVGFPGGLAFVSTIAERQGDLDPAAIELGLRLDQGG
jgi:hypothetical protein